MEWVSDTDAAAVLADSVQETLERVRNAYLAHAAGQTLVPRPELLRPPNTDRERFIALPALLVDDAGTYVGIKWIASFPGNVRDGRPRASAVIVLNSPATGRPKAVLGGAAISAARTGASAAIAAQALGKPQSTTISFIGAGPINLSVFRYLHAVWPDLQRARVFEPDADAAASFAHCLSTQAQISVEICRSLKQALEDAWLVSLATNVVTPFISDLSACDPSAVVLHVSLRDIAPDALSDCDNVTDDVGHVLSANTSLDVLHRQSGRPALAIVEIGQVLCQGNWSSGRRTVFSPFGLGALDIAVAELVLSGARNRGLSVELQE